MHIIKVDAIDSTNSFGRKMFRENPFLAPTCIVANQQLQGRGQRGTEWISKPGQNLTFSVVFPKPGVSLNFQFLLSAAVATAIIEVFEVLNIPKLKLKWPNDIMSANYKIGGILIENIVSEGILAATVIGVGLNVNQTEFERLPGASSLKLVTGQHFSMEELLDNIIAKMELRLTEISDSNSNSILQTYKSKLFRKGIPSTFQRQDKTFFTGIIEDVSPAGKLRVRDEEGALMEFELKEVKLCY